MTSHFHKAPFNAGNSGRLQRTEHREGEQEAATDFRWALDYYLCTSKP